MHVSDVYLFIKLGVSSNTTYSHLYVQSLYWHMLGLLYIHSFNEHVSIVSNGTEHGTFKIYLANELKVQLWHV
jgi:hypothetical protein